MRRIDLNNVTIFAPNKIILKRTYLGDWKNWNDVRKDFGEEKVAKKEPTHVFASYTYEDYSGEAIVIFKKKNKYYIVEASHCSCYGLSECDFKPTDHTIEDFNTFFKASYGFYHNYSELLRYWLLT